MASKEILYISIGGMLDDDVSEVISCTRLFNTFTRGYSVSTYPIKEIWKARQRRKERKGKWKSKLSFISIMVFFLLII